MPVREPGYDSFSNTNGTLVRTGGYPDGFSGVTGFGSAVFVAKKSGSGTISFSDDSMALDANNTNQYNGGAQLAMMIQALGPNGVQVNVATSTASSTPSSTATANPPAGEQPPEQLFDIALQVDQSKVTDVSSLGVRTTFTSFGTVPTPVTMTFDILNSSGVVVHSDTASTTVETQGVYNESLKGLTLSPGNYTMRLTTLYGTSTRDQFEQPFTVVAKTTSPWWLNPWLWIIGGVVVLIIIVWIIFVIVRRRKKEDQ
jgi:hypothetical protein